MLADPPWGLRRGQGRFADGHGYRGRDPGKVLGGYVDVEPADYPQFTREWVGAAATALRPGGQRRCRRHSNGAPHRRFFKIP